MVTKPRASSLTIALRRMLSTLPRSSASSLVSRLCLLSATATDAPIAICVSSGIAFKTDSSVSLLALLLDLCARPRLLPHRDAEVDVGVVAGCRCWLLLVDVAETRGVGCGELR